MNLFGNNSFSALSGQPGQGVQNFSNGAYQGAGANSLVSPSGYGAFGNTGTPGSPTPSTGGSLGSFFGSEGFASGMGAFSTLASMYTGFKSLGLAKDQFQFQKQAFNKNFNASAKSYENELKDRWEARSNAAASRGQSYAGMDQWVGDRAIDTSASGGKQTKKKGGG